MAKQSDVNRFIGDNLSAVRGKTVKEIMALLPQTASEAVVRIALHVNRIKPKRAPKSIYHLVNWNLPNKDLAEAWGLAAQNFANYRSENEKPSPRHSWQKDTPARRRARQAEVAKAAFHKTREG